MEIGTLEIEKFEEINNIPNWNLEEMVL